MQIVGFLVSIAWFLHMYVFTFISILIWVKPGMLYCLDALTEEQNWFFPFGYAQPSIANGVVYTNSYELYTHPGEMIWNNGVSLLSSPLIVEGVVYHDHLWFTRWVTVNLSLTNPFF
jgi:outer membrane protein assembly factor BamB